MFQQACPFQDAQRPLLFPSLSGAYNVYDLPPRIRARYHPSASRRLMTSRTFTPTASFLPSFKKKYTASTENALEKFYQLCWLPGSSVLKNRLKEPTAEQVPGQGYDKPAIALRLQSGRFSGQD